MWSGPGRQTTARLLRKTRQDRVREQSLFFRLDPHLLMAGFLFCLTSIPLLFLSSFGLLAVRGKVKKTNPTLGLSVSALSPHRSALLELSVDRPLISSSYMCPLPLSKLLDKRDRHPPLFAVFRSIAPNPTPN